MYYLFSFFCFFSLRYELCGSLISLLVVLAHVHSSLPLGVDDRLRALLACSSGFFFFCFFI